MEWVRRDTMDLAFSTLTYLVITLIIGFILAWYFKIMRKTWILDQLPGPKGIPVLGSALYLNVDGPEGFRRLIDLCKYGKIMKVWIAHLAYVLVSGHEEAEAILSSQKHLSKSKDYDFIQPWLGTGLLTSSGGKWRTRRKLLTPAFHFKILEDFIEVFNKQSFKMVEILSKKADGSPFDMIPYVTHCTLDIICETAMGQCVNAQDDSESSYAKALHRIGTLIDKRAASPWLHPDFLFKLSSYGMEHEECLKILHGFTRSIIKKKKESLAKTKKDPSVVQDSAFGEKKRLAFLDLLLEYSDNGKTLSDEDIREEVDTFMFEGHDTTTVAINWTLYLLGEYPDIQAKVHEELDSLLGESSRPITMEDLREMKLTENCIKEALRLYPSVPFIARDLKEDMNIGKHKVPAGTNLTVATYALHRDPEQFPDPEVFDPDRFLPENCKKRHPFAYIPFSAGPRNCIGQKFALMEEKIILGNILRTYRVESMVKREDLEVTGELILRPHEGNILKLFKRE